MAGTPIGKDGDFGAPKKKPLSNFAAEAAPLKGAVLLRIIRTNQKMHSTQLATLAEIEAVQVLVAANRELIRRFEAKIKTTIDRVWSAA